MNEIMMPRLESSGDSKDKKQSSFAEEFFLAQKDFYRHYAGDVSIEIKPASEAPEDIPTMAIDLEHGKIYVNPVFFEDRAYSLDKANFAVLHEHEHFRELKKLLDNEGGEQIWKKHQDKLKKKKRYAIFDNCFGDIKMNRSVLRRAPVLEKTEENLYKENLFASQDFTELPKHLQFSYALLREARLPEEECLIAPDVREKIEELRNKRSGSGVGLVDYATSPYTPMEMRLKLQEKYFEPVIDKFFEEDVKKKQEEQKQKQDKGEGSGEQGKEKNKGTEDGAQEKQGKKQKGKSADKKYSKKEGGKENGEPQNPEEYFQKEYAEYDKNNPHAVPIEDIEKAAEKYIKAKKGEKSIEDMSKEAYAKAEGVTVEELNEYERFWHEIENIKNPETNEFVIEELRAMFKRIINERKKKKYVSKYPTEEGEILAYPAEAVTAVKSGEREPKVWETVEQKERPKEMYGDFDVTLVADRSYSMQEDGVKYIEQRKAMALILEALKDFCGELEEARKDIEYDLNVRTEAWSFGDENQVEILKPLSQELTEKQRVHVYKKLADAPGNHTYDFLTLGKIRDGISEEDLNKIRERKLKKIIIVMSDGKSHGVSKVQEICMDLREKGVRVVGVGITNAGKSIEVTYAPDGKTCENPANLAKVLGDLLKNELKDL